MKWNAVDQMQHHELRLMRRAGSLSVIDGRVSRFTSEGGREAEEFGYYVSPRSLPRRGPI